MNYRVGIDELYGWDIRGFADKLCCRDCCQKNKVSGMEIGGVGCNVSFNLTGLCCNSL